MSSLPLRKRAKLWLGSFPLRVNRYYHSDFGRRQFNDDGIDVFEADWDNLLILDACRYDTFEKLHDFPGTLEKVESKASTTDEFMRANVDGRDLRDTVYVTASPSFYATPDVDAEFHAVRHLWQDVWDDELRTVLPEVVGEAAEVASGEYPNKRLVVHFMQPHYPFIGETGQEHFDYDHVGLDNPAESDENAEKFWDTVGTHINDVPAEIVWAAYEENLEAVLPTVDELLRTLEGKSVVTADHGEMIYNRASPIPNLVNGHPGGLYVPELVEVPWHTYSNGGRRTIDTGEAANGVDIEDSKVQERLRDLGYA